MTLSDKKLLVKYLCARLPYQLKVKVDNDKEPYTLLAINANNNICVIGLQFDDVYATSRVEIERIRPYLRKKASMTAEEWTIYHDFCDEHYLFDYGHVYFDTPESLDYLNENHIDYRGFINKGIAIEVTEENNPYKD